MNFSTHKTTSGVFLAVCPRVSSGPIYPKSRLPLAVHSFCAALLHVSPTTKHAMPPLPSHPIPPSPVSETPVCHSQQPNAATQAAFSEQWTRLLLAYARHCGLFILRIEDAEATGGGEWDEVLRNPRINRGSCLSTVLVLFFVFFVFSSTGVFGLT
jgi:hypothetical protein